MDKKLTNCSCLTDFASRFVQNYLSQLRAELNEIDASGSNQLKTIKDKLKRLELAVETIRAGLDIHQKEKREFMENVIVANKQYIFTGRVGKSMQTVPWTNETRNPPKDAQSRKKQKKKK